MRIKETVVVIDAADIDAVSAFWAALLDGRVWKDDEEGWHSVLVDDKQVIGVQRAPNHTPPEWPHGTQQQIHLDLHVDDLAAAHEEAVALGARLLQETTDPDAVDGFAVYADPAGHPFCLCWRRD